MDQREALRTFAILSSRFPDSKKKHFLHFENPYQILVLTILSAQTTDRQVNEVGNQFFSRYPTPELLASAKQEDVEPIIKSTGFYHNKAKHLIRTARKIVTVFCGQVPDTLDELLTLPGVGRKTANIVLNHAFGLNEGIAVDTHVKRVSYRIGYTDSQNPEKIEQELMALFPRTFWGDINYILIRHGREVCTAKNPNCQECVINTFCRYYRDLRK